MNLTKRKSQEILQLISARQAFKIYKNLKKPLSLFKKNFPEYSKLLAKRGVF